MINPSPTIYETTSPDAGRTEEEKKRELEDDIADPIDAQEIYGIGTLLFLKR